MYFLECHFMLYSRLFCIFNQNVIGLCDMYFCELLFFCKMYICNLSQVKSASLAGLGIFCVDIRFRTKDIVWNLNASLKTPIPSLVSRLDLVVIVSWVIS